MRSILGREILLNGPLTQPLEAFERFGKKLAKIEDRIMTMNNDKK